MKTFKRLLITGIFTVLSALVLSGCGIEGGGGGGGGISYLKIINAAGSTQEIWAVYSQPSSSSDWGSDRLGSSVIKPGYFHTFNTTNCDINYDLKIVWQDGTAETQMNYYRECGKTVTFAFSN
jgi:hypothetical protein